MRVVLAGDVVGTIVRGTMGTGVICTGVGVPV